METSLVKRTCVVLVALVLAATSAWAQMPDMRTMSGTPLPTGDLPAGSVAVRVIREALGNDLPGQLVELKVQGVIRSATTDETGRAVFSGLTPGQTVQAHAIVNGEHIDSQEFVVPGEGGIRVMLVAGLGATPAAPGAAAPAAPDAAASTVPAQAGTVMLGGQSRFIIELNDGALDIYNVFEIVNTSSAPVQTAQPLVFQFPDGARGAVLFEGTTPQAKAEGTRVVVTGPFAPGATVLQMAYQLPYTTGAIEFAQALPVELPTLVVSVNNTTGARFAAPLVTQTRDVAIDGKPFIMGTGGRVEAGTPIAFALDGLPYHSQVGRYAALGLVVLLLGGGAWLAVNGESSTLSSDRTRAVQKREQLLGELADLERHRSASLDPRIDSKREHLIHQLERVYRQLDHLGVGDEPLGQGRSSGAGSAGQAASAHGH